MCCVRVFVTESNGGYYSRRAQEELHAAECAADEAAARAHRELGRKYLALASLELERNRSMIAAGRGTNDNGPEEPPADA